MPKETKKNKNPWGNSINDFDIKGVCGYGGFAEVLEANCKNLGLDKTHVAIKKINKQEAHNRRPGYKIYDEVLIHSTLPPTHTIVTFYTSFEDEQYWYLVLELCTGGTLDKYLKRKKRLPEEEAFKLIKQVIQGVYHLHSRGIVHRDISLKNLLLADSDSCKVKIADFGLAIKLNAGEKANTVVGTADFMSPEIINHEPYDFKTDCWSIGCVLYALLYGSPPFTGENKEKSKRNVRHSPVIFPDYASLEAKEILKALLNKNQEQRIGLMDALKYPFFQKYEISGKGNKINHQKSGSDSGLNSLSSSGSKKSVSTHTLSTEYNCGPNHHKSKEERKNKFVKNAPAVRSHDKVYDNTRPKYQYETANYQKQRPELIQYQDSQNSPGFGNQLKNKFDTLPSRYESQYATPVKNRPESPPYPADVLQYLAKRDLNTQLCYSDYDSASYQKSSLKCSSNLTLGSSYKQNSFVKSCAGNPMQDPTCSHGDYCISDNNCIHKQSCCCRQLRIDSLASLRNCTMENHVDVRNTVVERCLKDIVSPLNTARILYCRREVPQKDLFFTILSDGQVCLESFKIIKGQKYVHLVYLISGDGQEITIYKPKKKIPLNRDQPPPIPQNEGQCFCFENLPSKHWRKYRIAKYLVDQVRVTTPKVTIYGELAACKMMEYTSNPDFDMYFYDGFQIAVKGNKTTIKDKNGCIVADCSIRNLLQNEFEKMKKKCIMLEENIKTFHDSNFPVVLGKKPNIDKRKMALQENGKENMPTNCMQSPSLNELNSSVRRCHISIGNNESSLFQNTFPRSTSTPYSSEKSTSSSKSMTNFLPHLKSLKVVNDFVIVEYKDDIEMCVSISMPGDKKFCNAKTRKTLSTEQYPKLDERYKNDYQDILRCALLSKMKT